MNEIKISSLVSSLLLKVSRTFRVDLALELQTEVICKLLTSSVLLSTELITSCTGGHFDLAPSLSKN